MMKDLSDAMRRVAALTQSGDLMGATEAIQAALGGGAKAPGKRSPEVSRQYQGAAGARDYLLYVPEGLVVAKGMIMMLHGCQQTPGDFATGTAMNAQADALGFVVVYPGQSRGANVQGCWNWFEAGHQKRDLGEPAILAGIAGEVAAKFGLTRARCFVAGLSAGGAMAATLGQIYPDVFAGVGVHSGLAHGSADDLMSALAAMRGQGRVGRRGKGKAAQVRTIILHGDADNTVHPSNAGEVRAAARHHLPKGLSERVVAGVANGRRYSRLLVEDASGRCLIEDWTIAGAGHAWSGGNAAGSFTDAKGPDASAEMARFFFDGLGMAD